jgi:hypothetical protein
MGFANINSKKVKFFRQQKTVYEFFESNAHVLINLKLYIFLYAVRFLLFTLFLLSLFYVATNFSYVTL